MKRLTSIFFILLLSCTGNHNKGFDQDGLSLIDAGASLDVKLSRPQPGEWLYEHKEDGQTFEEYKLAEPVSPNSRQRKIYLQPVGKFTSIQNDVIRYTADYLAMYFGLETVVSDPIDDNIIPYTARRKREDGHEQLLTTHFLNSLLPARFPDDAIVVMAITEKDLYPAESWNFVFGQASLKKRIGVSSMYRYTIDFLDTLNYPVCLERLIKTSSHEIGHMFTCQHCTYAICVMNGSNSLYESDMRPNRLCTQCQKKLYWNLKFDVVERARKLSAYFKKHKLETDYKIISADLHVYVQNL
jgi:archaemetzincin